MSMDLRSSLDRATLQKQTLFSINFTETTGATSPTHSNSGSRANLAEDYAINIDNQQSQPVTEQNAIPLSFQDDFIMVSEFSELEGPIPLFYVPEVGNPQGSFNVNDFVLRIMAVDNQNKNADISFAQDTQVVMTEPKEKAIAYIHHFSLLDIFARGYVRPICLSYITHDPKKIMSHFTDFVHYFSEIANIFKNGNRDIFKRDLEHRVMQLEHSQSKTNKVAAETTETSENSENTNEEEPNNVSEYLRDLKELHERLHGPAEENSFRGNSEGAPEMGGEINGDLTGMSYFQSSKPTLRTLEELCGSSYHKAVQLLRDTHVFLSRPCLVLELEREEQIPLYPPSSVLSVGNSFVLNFNVEVERHHQGYGTTQQQQRISTTGKSNGTKVTFSTNNLFSEAQQIPSDDHLNNNNNNNKEDGNASSSSSSAYGSPNSIMSSSPNTLMEAHLNRQAMEKAVQSAAPSFNNPSSIYSDSSYCDSATFLSVESLLKTSYSNLNPSDVNLHNSPFLLNLSEMNSENSLENFCSTIWNCSGEGIGRGMLDMRSKYSPAILKGLIFSLLKGRTVVVYGQPSNEYAIQNIISALSIFVPGHSIHKKAASSNSTIHGVIPWYTKHLKMSDLASMRLIGLSKQRAIPKGVEKYVSVFDFEAEVLRAPPYAGYYIEEMLNSKRQWPDEDTFLAHLNCVLLDLGMKVFLFFHMCCVGIPYDESQKYAAHQRIQQISAKNLGLHQTRSASILEEEEAASLSAKYHTHKPMAVSNNSALYKARRSFSDSNLTLKILPTTAKREHSKSAFFKKWNLQRSDVQIIEHLAEVVKQQLAFGLNGFDQAVPVIRLDYSPCQVIKNVKK